MDIKVFIKKVLAHPQLPEVLSWLVYGLVVGAVAQILIPGRGKFGWLTTMIIGIAGAILGGAGARYLGYSIRSGWNLYGFIAAICGAVVLLVACYLFAELID